MRNLRSVRYGYRSTPGHVLLAVEDQLAAHDGIPVSVLPEGEKIWHKIVAEPYLVGVEPIKIGHKGLPNL